MALLELVILGDTALLQLACGFGLLILLEEAGLWLKPF